MRTGLAVPPGHTASVHAREPVTEAMPEPTTETVTETAAKAMVEMVEGRHGNDRGCEAKEPGRPAPTPTAPAPIRGEIRIGIGIGFGIGIGRGSMVKPPAAEPRTLAAAIPGWFG